jgi:hypothetical protein
MAQFGIDGVEMRSQPRDFQSPGQWLGADGRDGPSAPGKGQRARQYPGGREDQQVPTHRSSLA